MARRRRRDDRRRGFEAIHQAGGLGPIVVVLNDNGMSITERRGDVAVLQPRPAEPKWHAARRVEADSPSCGEHRRRRAPRAALKESIKAFWAPGLFWEELDWAYVGVIDGHDVRAPAGRRGCRHRPSGDGRRPRCGFALAEDGGLEGMEKRHAAKPKSIANGVPAPAIPRRQTRPAAVHGRVRPR